MPGKSSDQRRALDALNAAHVWLQRLWHVDRAILVLVVLHDRDQRPAHGQTRAI